jgi:hypothetical protein
LQDLIVDTNVYVHANNSGNAYQAASITFLETLLRSTTALCMDDKFDYPEAQNRSIIGHEFYQHVRPGMLGYTVVVTLASNGRLKLLSPMLYRGIRDKVRRSVPNNAADRQFIAVTYNSIQKVFASHDFADMPQSIRDLLHNEIGVRIVIASDAIDMLSAG